MEEGMREAARIEGSALRKASLVFIHFVELPAWLCYALFVFVIFKDLKHLGTGRFFEMFISLGVADLLVVIVSNVDRYVATHGIMNHWPDWAQIYYLKYFQSCLWSSLCSAQIVSSFVMTINRFTALVLPFRHTSIWEPKRTLIIAIVCCWIPSVFIGAVLATNDHFHPVLKNCTSDACSVQFRFEISQTGYTLWFVWMMLSMVSVVVTCSVLYAVMCVCMIKHRLSGATALLNQEMRKKRAREIKLACHVFTNILFLVVYLLYFSLMMILNGALFPVSEEWSARLWPIFHLYIYAIPFIDLFGQFGNPVTLMLMSSVVRERVSIFLGTLKRKLVSGGDKSIQQPTRQPMAATNAKWAQTSTRY